MNRQLARERLAEALEQKRATARAEIQSQREKSRRQNRPKPRGLKRRILDSKKKRGSVKKLRGRVEG